MTDRPYQTRCVSDLRAAVGRGHRSICCVAPTGSGKMHIAARLIELARRNGKRAAFFADQRELVQQCKQKLQDLGIPAHMLMAGNTKQAGEDAMWFRLGHVPVVAKDTLWARCFSKQAYRNRLRLAPPELDLILFDEAHKSLSKTWSNVASYYLKTGAVLIGFTATPCRGDNRGLGGMYDCLVQMATYKELQRDGYLVPVKVYAPTRPDLEGLKVVRGDFREADLDKRLNKRSLVGDIVTHWQKLARGRSTVAFAVSVSHSLHLRDLFRGAGVAAEHLDAQTSLTDRDRIIAGCRDGSVQVLCNYGVATTGVDVPQWKYMICARPTMSFGLWRQMAGRIQRPLPGHQECVIQDHADNTLLHGFPDDDIEWSLDSDMLKTVVARRRKQQERKPIHCPRCGTVYKKLPSCPDCGFQPTRQGKAVHVQEKKLLPIPKTKRKYYVTRESRQREWDHWLSEAAAHNYKMGWAAHRYKSRVGKWPGRDLQRVPRGHQWHWHGKQFASHLGSEMIAAAPAVQQSLPQAPTPLPQPPVTRRVLSSEQTKPSAVPSPPAEEEPFYPLFDR